MHMNTKGKGSDDGRFIGTNVLNEGLAILNHNGTRISLFNASRKIYQRIKNEVKGNNDFMRNLLHG